MNLIEVIKSFLVGLGVGAIVTFFKLPLPAPPVFAGIMGIFGIFVGYILVGHFIK
jgi:XapX domain-containing protein